MNSKNPKVDGYLRKAKWQKELTQLRKIILECPLTEDMKWRVPCYTLNNKNVILLGGFKEFCVLNFVKGALLKDSKGILKRIGQNTQAGRWIQFTNVPEIVAMKSILKSYIEEAIEMEKAGLKVPLKKASDFPVPEELQRKLDEMPDLKAAFNALTPGRQRAYLLYFSAAKQATTRQSRVAKCIPQILTGKGLDD